MDAEQFLIEELGRIAEKIDAILDDEELCVSAVVGESLLKLRAQILSAIKLGEDGIEIRELEENWSGEAERLSQARELQRMDNAYHMAQPSLETLEAIYEAEEAAALAEDCSRD